MALTIWSTDRGSDISNCGESFCSPLCPPTAVQTPADRRVMPNLTKLSRMEAASLVEMLMEDMGRKRRKASRYWTNSASLTGAGKKV